MHCQYPINVSAGVCKLLCTSNSHFGGWTCKLWWESKLCSVWFLVVLILVHYVFFMDVGLLQLGLCIYPSESSLWGEVPLYKLFKAWIALGNFASCISCTLWSVFWGFVHALTSWKSSYVVWFFRLAPLHQNEQSEVRQRFSRYQEGIDLDFSSVNKFTVNKNVLH